jgi:hypothetical protein
MLDCCGILSRTMLEYIFGSINVKSFLFEIHISCLACPLIVYAGLHYLLFYIGWPELHIPIIDI